MVEKITDITGRIQAAAKTRRLSSMYGTLCDVRRGIVGCRTRDELFASVFQGFARSNIFPAAVLALIDPGDDSLHITGSRGIPADLLPELEKSLAVPAERTKPAALPRPEGDAAWPGHLQKLGITDFVLVPLNHDGTPFGVVGLFVAGKDVIDEGQLVLLDSVAADVSLALDMLSSAEGRRSAEDEKKRSERRFRVVFDASPLPMQIFSANRHRVLAINRAFQTWLGYTLEDIANEDDWLGNFYPDPEIRRTVRALWSLDDDASRDGNDRAASSEHILRAKDGSFRVAVGILTRVGDEAMLAWHDMTEIRRKVKACIASEAQFRNMIEQSSVGIYVRRSGRFIYANPRYCEIIGYPREEVIGLDIHKVTTADPDNLRRIYAAWERLESGEPNVTYRVPLIRKDGVVIELELHAKRVDWEGQPADIVVVDDITDRKNQEDKIANYVQQLEGSMKATLHAISNMVEMRDPITAGHESRVGRIARDIAREMGWPEDRSSFMEMIGLVHDIGKIGIPAEILTKPGILKAHEMALMQDHAQAGYEILKDIPFPAPVARIIGQHHERMDGSGYPNRLKGDEILPEARILAVADVLDTISSNRPYRAARGLLPALEELKANRGTLFDPDVVDAVLRMFEGKGYKLPS